MAGKGRWDYFVKTIQIEGQPYNLLANVAKTADNQYVYSIELKINKNIEAAPALGPEGSEGEPFTASDTSISEKTKMSTAENRNYLICGKFDAASHAAARGRRK